MERLFYGGELAGRFSVVLPMSLITRLNKQCRVHQFTIKQRGRHSRNRLICELLDRGMKEYDHA